ncbi:MAG: T9SS type A sorting domain-containing protein [Sphingobacteriales bacterium]|nr:MAG: T9SS type A sorting domain-containing protein [Sphingobacteriales bacterium]
MGTLATVLNLQGQPVARFEIQDGLRVDVSHWLPGLYLVHLASGETLRISKP